MPFGVPSTQFPKEERHDIRETFTNSLSQCFFDGQALRLEFSRPAWINETSTRQANGQTARRRTDGINAGGRSRVVQRLHANGRRIRANRNSERDPGAARIRRGRAQGARSAAGRPCRAAAGTHRRQAGGREIALRQLPKHRTGDGEFIGPSRQESLRSPANLISRRSGRRGGIVAPPRQSRSEDITWSMSSLERSLPCSRFQLLDAHGLDAASARPSVPRLPGYG